MTAGTFRPAPSAILPLTDIANRSPQPGLVFFLLPFIVFVCSGAWGNPCGAKIFSPQGRFRRSI